ncbi:urease accessory protein UreD [Paenibacillus thermoaerophilus]|uniref:Urease accessory protein UreD n=1 Tax=Paenibacillus thermoaerophilus TaxID=1215385 RepID=A0ABW2V194_9BACL|nr:urease accessory protein UreD [Paenibacillus thermoaerophilus]TMV18443.1 hypothetical protein FE781_03245 [Paenibacillus thermoaerophilus]
MPETVAALRARFVKRGRVTELAASFARSPLKLAKTFELAGGQAGVIVMDCSPGMMAGDRYEQTWEIGPEASVKVGSQSFTKVHPSGGRPSVQRLRFKVERGALLEWMPEPLMLYDGAILDSECTLELAEGAAAVMMDVVCPGRSLRGETFRYERFDSRMTVTDPSGGTIYCSRQRMEPARQHLTSPAVWGSFTHMGSLWIFSDRLRPEHGEWLHRAAERVSGLLPGSMPPPSGGIAGASRSVEPAGRLLAGASTLERRGLVLQALGTNAWEIRAALAAAWSELRGELTRELGQGRPASDRAGQAGG